MVRVNFGGGIKGNNLISIFSLSVGVWRARDLFSGVRLMSLAIMTKGASERCFRARVFITASLILIFRWCALLLRTHSLARMLVVAGVAGDK
jgi:hypothetical protein